MKSFSDSEGDELVERVVETGADAQSEERGEREEVASISFCGELHFYKKSQ